jgi:hypothetical protein
MVEVSWSRAGEGVTLRVWLRTEAGPRGKFRQYPFVFKSLDVLRTAWPQLAAAIEEHGGSHGHARVVGPGQEN